MYTTRQDGSIAFELKLSGILSTSVAPLGEGVPAHGVRVSPGVNATVHQVRGRGTYCLYCVYWTAYWM